MPLYRVEVTRVGYSHVVMEIDAENVAKAKECAIDEAADRVLSEKSSEYDVESVDEVRKKLTVEYEVDTHGDADESQYRVSCGSFELRHIYVSSSSAALDVYAEGNHLDLDDCDIEDLTGESDYD